MFTRMAIRADIQTSIVEIHIHHTCRTAHTVSAFNGMDDTHIPLGTANLWRTRRQEIPKSIWLFKTLGEGPRPDATPVEYRAGYVAYYGECSQQTYGDGFLRIDSRTALAHGKPEG